MKADRIGFLKLLKTKDRSSNLYLNIAGSIFLKGTSIFLSLLVVPLTIDYISPYHYGVWITISSLIGWLSFFDIGFGNGLKNKLVEAIANGKNILGKIYISTVYAILTVIILIIWVLAIIASNFINWSQFLNVTDVENKQFVAIIFIVLSAFAFQFILGLINTILSAIQKPVVTSLINVITQLLTLIGIYILSKSTEGSLLNLSLLTGVVNTSVLAIFSLYLFNTSLKNYCPKLKYIRLKFSKGLLSLGLNFFLLQIIAIIYYETNNIIIAKVLNPLNVTTYNLAFKYVSVVGMIFSILISPFWSAFVEAKVLKDFDWMKKEISKLYKIFLYFVIGAIGIVLISPIAYNIWFGDAVQIPLQLTVCLGVWQIFNMWNSLHSTLIYGFGTIRLQIISSTIIGILNVPITIWFCQNWGLTGVVLSQILLASAISWIGPTQLKLLFNGRANGIWNR